MAAPAGDALVLDVGTGTVKAARLGPAGEIRGSCERPLDTHTAEGGVMEQASAAWWQAAIGAAQDLGAAVGVGDVALVVLTGQMQNLTLLADDGTAVRPTLSYGDVRAVAEAGEVLERVGAERLRALTGNEQDAGGLLAKLRWLGRHEPDALARARHLFLGAADVLAFGLTGEAACDGTTASTTGLLELDRGTPLEASVFEACGLAGVRERLPRIVPGGARVGSATPAAAEAFGVAAGTPVHLGPGDAGATTVGAGSGEPGPASAYVGTSGWVAFTASERGDPAAGVFTLAHPAPERTIQVAPLLTAGGNLDWARAALGAGADHATLIEEALARPAGTLLYLPYLRGERSPVRDPHARGAFVGLSTATTHLDMVRAVLEGVAFGYRHALQALGGAAPERLTLSGGGTRSRAWCALFATVLGVPVQVLRAPESVGVRGAHHCARVARGEAPDFAVAPEAETFEPDDAWRAHYDAAFERYLALYPALRDTFAAARAG